MTTSVNSVEPQNTPRQVYSTWIIGASTGIGAALIKALDKADTQIFVSARNLSALQSKLPAYAARIIPIEMDVVDEQSISEALSRLRQHTAHLDRVIVNAGTCEYIDSETIDIDAVKRVMNTNFFGAIQVINGCLPLMRAAKGHTKHAPQLVLVSSSVTYLALPRAGAYGASKAAIRYFMECLKLDVQHEGLDVRVVSPGFVKTPLTDKNDFPMPFRISADETAKRIAKGLAGRRFDIHFPKRFTLLLKMMSWLPDALRFPLVGKSSRHPAEP